MQIHEDELSDVARYIAREEKGDFAVKEAGFEGLLRYLTRFRKIDSSLKMLEVGTGIGWVPIIAKKRGWNLTGLEISPMLVEAGKQWGRRMGVEPDIQLGNIEEYDVGENVYDIIIANSVFEHVEHWRKGLERLHRALKPGGLMFFESTNKWSFTSGEFASWPLYGWLPNAARYKLRQMIHGKDIMKNGIDFHQFTYMGLRRAFREIGFSKVYDRVQALDADTFPNEKKRGVLKACQKNAALRHLVLTFFETTTFIVQK